MWKNFSPQALGVSGRQSELIELALTYGFRGIDLNTVDAVKRAENQGVDNVRRFIASANIPIGTFDLPVRLDAEEAQYQEDLAALDRKLEILSEIGAERCVANLRPASDRLPYHENFEEQRKRLGEVAERLSQREMRLGVGFLAAAEHRQDVQFEFIHQAEELLSLVKAVAASNVGLLIDTWNWHVGQGGLDQLRELSPEQIVAVRVADAPDDVDPAQLTDEQRRLPGEGGLIDPVAYLKTLKDMEYDGPATPYPHPKQFKGMTRDSIVQRAAISFGEAWQSAGLEGDLGRLTLAPAPASVTEGAGEGEGEGESKGEESTEGEETSESTEKE